MATSTSTDATKTERLLLVKTGKAACHLPAPAATSELVLDAIKTSHALTDDERFALAQAWTSGSTFDENRIKQLDPDVRRNAMVKDRQLYAACESEFQLHDVGRHGNMHDKLSLCACRLLGARTPAQCESDSLITLSYTPAQLHRMGPECAHRGVRPELAHPVQGYQQSGCGLVGSQESLKLRYVVEGGGNAPRGSAYHFFCTP